MRPRLVTSLVLFCVGQAALPLLAQTGPSHRPVSTPALQYFAGGHTSQLLAVPQASPVASRQNPYPRPRAYPKTAQDVSSDRERVQQQAVAGRAVSKPFADVDRPPTLSPYLNLDVIESEQGLPNYHAWVRPQVRQRRERLQAQRQRARVAAASQRGTASTAAAAPASTEDSQFLNMGNYFPGLVR